jgi:hypothetical protein
MTPAATTAYRQRPYIDAHPTHATTIRSQPISSLDRATRRTSNRRSMLARDGDQLQTELGETSAEPWYLRLSAKTLIFHKGSVLGLASLTRTTCQTRSVAQPRHQEFRLAPRRMRGGAIPFAPRAITRTLLWFVLPRTPLNTSHTANRCATTCLIKG